MYKHCQVKYNFDGMSEPIYKVYMMSENIHNYYYIGQTKTPLKERIRKHCNGSSNKTSHHYIPAVHNHFNKIGWKHVSVQIICSACDEDELNMKESECITNCESDPLMLNNNMPRYQNIKYPSYEKCDECSSYYPKYMKEHHLLTD